MKRPLTCPCRHLSQAGEWEKRHCVPAIMKPLLSGTGWQHFVRRRRHEPHHPVAESCPESVFRELCLSLDIHSDFGQPHTTPLLCSLLCSLTYLRHKQLIQNTLVACVLTLLTMSVLPCQSKVHQSFLCKVKLPACRHCMTSDGQNGFHYRIVWSLDSVLQCLRIASSALFCWVF